MKIEQENDYPLEVWKLNNSMRITQIYDDSEGYITIQNTSSREVALSICPDFQNVENRNNYLEAENSGLIDLHFIDDEEIKRLKNINELFESLLKDLKTELESHNKFHRKNGYGATFERELKKIDQALQQSENKTNNNGSKDV